MTETPNMNDASTCPLCGGNNQCGNLDSGSGKGECWCREQIFPPQLLARVPADLVNRACICPRCLALEQGRMSLPLVKPT